MLPKHTYDNSAFQVLLNIITIYRRGLVGSVLAY